MLTDWIMIIITVIYVIATIFICRANFISAKETKKQVEVSERQFEEMRRLEAMPYLQFESVPFDKGDFGISLPMNVNEYENTFSHAEEYKLRNLGNGSAKDIIFTWENESLGISEVDYPAINAIMAGHEYRVEIWFDNCTVKKGIDVYKLTLQYNDMLDNTYEQWFAFEFEFDGNIKNVKCEAGAHSFLDKVKYALTS